MESFFVKNDRGVCTCINSKLTPQRIPEIEDKAVDCVWTSFNINSSVYLLGNFYTNPNSASNHLQATTENIKCALDYAEKYKIKQVIVLGDFNSRHNKWGDSVTNTLGTVLDEFISEQGLLGLSPNTFTFKRLNGGSVIDLAFVSKSYHSSSVEETAELFSGAPFRGHFPVIHQFNNLKPITQKCDLLYKDLKNTIWNDWRTELTQRLFKLEVSLESHDNASSLWNSLKQIITEVNDHVIPTKRISTHSKPFWTNELTKLSQGLQLNLNLKINLQHNYNSYIYLF